ncbi:hypothetical protein R3P38DRAFT_3272555 [Favolaschia claudopus]|uniref:Uncharacterized protein n=1 Tax=Favolaschia claudopus TaxID=2862362 RepID=A0AAW0B3I6_9AGAR
MFSLAVLALAVSAQAHSISRVHRHVPRSQPPAGWATSYLENYDVYHTRYTHIGCESKHNTTFFDLCCHPLLATESVEQDRNACCAVGTKAVCPGTVPSSSVAAQTKTAAPPPPAKNTASPDNDGDDDEDCDDDDDNNADPSDDDDEDCEDDGDDNEPSSASHAAPTTSHAVAPTTSSHAAAPTTTHTTPTTPSTHSTAKAPTTTHTTPTTTATHTTAKVPTTTKAAPTQPPTNSGSGGKNTVTGGIGTWFDQGGVAGACGKVHQDSDFVVALQTQTYANGAHCGQGIQICDMTTNKCVNGVVADECPGCNNPQSVDMSRAMFQALAPLSVGVFEIGWHFTN